MATIAKKPAAPVKKAAPAAKKGFPARRDPNAPAPKLTAEQKARRAAAEAKKKLRMHKAPTDMKPFCMELTVRTAKDGMLTPKIKAERIRGRWDNPDAKRFDMMEYDRFTVAALVSRMGAMLYASNPERRLTPLTSYSIVLRVTARKADGVLVCRVLVAKRTIKKGDKTVWSWFDKVKDKATPDWRKIRRSVQNAGGAFVDCQLPPAGRQPKKGEEAE